jgi:NitT/TauT family transport system substrate-binding protein
MPVIRTPLRALEDPAPGRLGAWAVMMLACLTMVGCGRAEAPASHVTIRIGTYLWPGSYWIDVAAKKGWFAEAGLDVERHDVNLKYFASLDAVVAGRLDAMGFSEFDLVRHVAAGDDLVGIAAIDYSVGAEALVSRGNIHQLRDLKGKRLSLHRGTYLEYLLAIIAEREDFDLAEVTLIDQTGEQAIADYKLGRVDAILVWEPYVTEALHMGGQLLFTAADFPGLTYSVLALRHDFIQAHPNQVAALVRVWHRTERYIRQNPDEACAIVAQLTGNPVQDVHDLMRTVQTLDLADNGRAFSYAAGFESLHGSWRRMNDFMLDRHWVGSRVDSPAHLDSSFIQQLE